MPLAYVQVYDVQEWVCDCALRFYQRSMRRPQFQQWPWLGLGFLRKKHKSSILCFAALLVHHTLFVSVVNDTRRPSILLLLCCTFSPPPPISPNPAACLLRGLCMKSHCHVQGRAAQGQLIAFMIMISRQIYRACSKHIFLVLPTLLAWMGKMSLQLLAVTSCLSAGHTFWLTRVEHRGWITLSFPVKDTVFYASNCTCFAHICPQKSIFNTLTWTYTLVWRSWQRNDTDRDFGFSAVWTFFIFFFMSHKSFNFVSVSSWNR